MEIQALNSDRDRVEVEQFLAANIPAEQARVSILPRGNDPHRGYRSYILAIREAGTVIAALYAAPPVLEVAEMRMRGWPAQAGEAALLDFVMLYDVATAPGHRRRGLAASMVSELENRVRATSAHTIYGVCSSDSANFYGSQGYDVLPRNQAIETMWGTTPVRFPIEGDAQWFSKLLTGAAGS